MISSRILKPSPSSTGGHPLAETNGARAVYVSLIICSLMVVGSSVRDYGVGWDEFSASHYAELALNYFTSFGRDTSCNEFFNLKVYGPTVDLLAAIGYTGFPDLKIEIRHALSALIGIGSVPALVRLGRLYGNDWVGIVAGASLLLMASVSTAMAFVNSKDIPFATAFAWVAGCGDSALAAEAILVEGLSVRWTRTRHGNGDSSRGVGPVIVVHIRRS